MAGCIESFTVDHFIPRTSDRPFALRGASGFNANFLVLCTEQLRAQAGFISAQLHPQAIVFWFRLISADKSRRWNFDRGKAAIGTIIAEAQSTRRQKGS